jgi:hypothetical protein
VGPFGLCNSTFNDDVINLLIIITTLSLSVEVGVGTSGNCKDCAVFGENVSLLRRFLNLRWRWWIDFGFDLRGGVFWHGVCDLWHRRGICYLWSWRRLSMVGCGVMV